MQHRGVATVAIIGGIALSACSTPRTNAESGPPTSAAAPAAVATQGQSCADEVHTWAHGQGLTQVQQVGGDLKTVSKLSFKVEAAFREGGNAARPLAEWQAAVTALETDAQAAASNPPPGCANAANYSTLMQDSTTAAKDYLSFISDYNSGRYSPALTLLNAGTAAIQQGTSALGHTKTFLSTLRG
jgi:hypothetical protein